MRFYLYLHSLHSFQSRNQLSPDHGVLYISKDIKHYSKNIFGSSRQVIKDLISYYKSGPVFTRLDYVADSTALKGPHDVKWSPDGKYAAIAGKFGSFALISIDRNGKIDIKAYKTHQDDPALVDVQTVEWSSNEKYVFAGTKDYFPSYSWDGSTLSRAGEVTDKKLEQINGMHLVGDYAFTASKINYIHAIDVSDPVTPVILDRYDTVNDGLMAPHDVAGWGDYIAVADQRRGVAGRVYIQGYGERFTAIKE